jgi:hypothetical protein
VTSPAPARSLVIVTAAAEAYAGCLGRLLRNLERRGLASTHRIVAYDLGLTAARHAALARRFPWCEFRRFDFAAHPPHVALEQRTYAWKPLLLAQVLGETSAPVLWLDSASQVRTDLGAVHAGLARHGLYALRGQSPLRERCDPAVSRALAAPPPLLDEREYVAGAVAFDPAFPAVRALVAEWRRCALDPALLLPRHPRHNPEQAVLSLLILRGVAAGELTLDPGDIDISSSSPVPWLGSREKLPASWPAWADPLAWLYYRTYAAADQFLIRLRRLKATRINGLHRWPKENFRIVLDRTSSPGPHVIPAPPLSYYADPFLWRHEGRAWLFVEQFLFLQNSARLVALPLDDALRAGPPRPIALLGAAACHRSFPHIFAHDGRLFLLPESSAQRSVDLFVCEEFPDRWRWQRRLLDGVDAADSALLHHAGRWWLFTSVRPTEDAPRALEIHHTDDLLTGRWEPHPINAERRYADAPCSTGRCAGAFVRTADGARLRPVQSSPRYYGQGARVMRLVTLTPDAFHEEEFTGAHPLAALAARVSPHHLSAFDDVIAGDVRTRVSYGRHVPLWRRWALTPRRSPSAPGTGGADRIKLVTAADQKYWRCLYQFLANLERCSLAAAHTVIAYDLGLTPATLKRLSSRFPWCEFRRFAFERYPAHYAIAAEPLKELYAWKASLLNEVAAETEGTLLWCDSATLFHVNDLAFLVKLVRTHGVYALRATNRLGAHCSPVVCARLGIPPDVLQGREYCSGLCGFDLRQAAARVLLTKWHEVGRDPRNLEAVFFGTGTHMRDQAVLGLLLHAAARSGTVVLGTDDIDLSCGRPVMWVSTRNKVGPGVPLWLDPLVRLWHRTYKVVDQFLWRIKGRRAAAKLSLTPSTAP